MEYFYDYIAVDDTSAAKKIVSGVFKKVETLKQNLERGRKVPEANREEIREVFESKFKIIYRVELKKVFIITIRNFKLLLRSKDIK